MSEPKRLTPEQRAEYFLAREDLPADSMRHARLSEMVRTAMLHARTAALDEAARVAREHEIVLDDSPFAKWTTKGGRFAQQIAAAIEALKE